MGRKETLERAEIIFGFLRRKNKENKIAARPRWGESGNVFFTLFGAVALVGVVGATTSTLMRGPVGTVIQLNQRAKADAQMQIAQKLSMLAAAQEANSGDCDSDQFVEPLAPAACSGSGPTGGGCIPNQIGSAKMDPWGTEYGYCAWDHGSINDDSVCLRGILNGKNGSDRTVVAIISAGPNRVFSTSCNNYVNDSTDLVASSGDDLVLEFTFAEAVEASGGLWKLKSGDPDTAEIDKDIEVSGQARFQSAQFSGPSGSSFGFDAGTELNLAAGALLKLPTDSTSGACGAANDGVLRIDYSSGRVLQLCHDGTGWVDIGGSGATSSVAGADTQVQYNDGGAFGAEAAFTYDAASDTLTVPNVVANTDLQVDGNTTLGDAGTDTVTMAGNATVGGTLGVTGTTTLGTLNAGSTTLDSLGVTNNATVGGTLGVTGTATMSGNASVGGTLGVTGVATMTDNLVVNGTLTDLNSNLEVSGTSTLTGNTSVGGTLDVTGVGTFTTDVDAGGDMTANAFRLNGDGGNFDEGLYYSSAGNGLELRTQGNTRLEIDAAGDIGINLGSAPTTDVDIGGVIRLRQMGETAGANCSGLHGAITYTSGDELLVCSDLTGNWETIGTSGGGGGGTAGLWDEETNYIRRENSTFIIDEGAGLPLAGAGSRMFWYPNKSAFRAGQVTGTQWNDANVGTESAAFGLDAQAGGNQSFAAGSSVYADGNGSIALGFDTRVNNANSMAIGLGDSSPVTAPQVSASSTLGIFMGDQDGLNLTSSNLMMIAGGRLLVDPGAPATQTNTSGSLDVDVEGNLGAINFCDENGANCFTAQQVATGSVTAPGVDRQVIFNSGGALNATSGFVFTSTGRLGVGTDAPQTTLHIAGTGTFNDNVFMTGTGALELPAGIDGERPVSANAGMLRFNSSTNAFEGYNGTDWNGFMTGAAGSDRELLFNSGGEVTGNANLVFTSSGNVGIGDASPDSGTGGQLVLDVAGNAGAAQFCDENGDNCFTAASVSGGDLGNPGDDREIFFNSNGELQTNDNFVFSSLGRLGVGVAAPDNDLDIAGTAEITGATVLGGTLDVSGNTNIDGTFDVLNGNATALSGTLGVTGAASFAEDVRLKDGLATDPALTFTNDQDTGLFSAGADNIGFAMGGSELIRFTSQGEIGVGVTDAQALLDVDGTIKMAYGGEACDAAREGAIHFDSSTNEFKICMTSGSWDTIATGASASPGAPDRGIQFNSNGAFTADSNFVYTSTGRLGLGVASPLATLHLTDPVNPDNSQLMFTLGDEASTPLLFDHVRATKTSTIEWMRDSGWSVGAVSLRAGSSAVETLLTNTARDVGGGAPTNQTDFTISTMRIDAQDTTAAMLAYETNKATSGDDTGLLIAKTDTSSPGVSRLIEGQTDGNTKFWIDDTGIMFVSNRLGVGTDTPATTMEIHDGAGGDAILRLSDTTYTLPDYSASSSLSGVSNTNTFAQIRPRSAGAALQGFTTSGNNTGTPLTLYGTHGGTAPTGPAVEIAGQKWDGGTNRTALTGDEIILDVNDLQGGAGNTVFRIHADGRVRFMSVGAAILNAGTTAQRPDNAENGMIRYNASTNSFEGYQGGTWQEFASAAGASPGTPDRGVQFNSGGAFTADANFVFDTNGRLGIGTGSPAYTLDVNGDINFSSRNGLYYNGQTFARYEAGINWETMFLGTREAHAGYDPANSFGGNTFIGIQAGRDITTGAVNTTIGHEAGAALTSGSANVMIGMIAGFNTNTGNSNVFIGDGVASANIDGDVNVIIGKSAMNDNTNGWNNVVLGHAAGEGLTSGSSNILIGSDAVTPDPVMSNYLNIGGIFYGSMGTGELFIGSNGALRMPVGPDAARPGTLAGTSAAAGMIRYNSTSDQFEGYVAGLGWDPFATGTPTAATPDRGVQFNSGGSFTADSNFVFTSLGNLGLGTGVPAGRLDVAGDSDIPQMVVRAHSTQTSNLAELYDSSGALAFYITDAGEIGMPLNFNGRISADDPDNFIDLTGAANSATWSADGDLIMLTNGGSERLRITSEGLVRFTSSGAIVVPRGDTAQRPDVAEAGMIRYNSTSDVYEGYVGGAVNAWQAINTGSGGLWTDNTTHISYQSAFILNGGETMTTAGFDGASIDAMIWHPDKAAFRAGGVDTNNRWDEANIGTYSTAFGENARASGAGSFAVSTAQFAANALGDGAFALGTNVNANGDHSIAMGSGSGVDGYVGIAIGLNLYAQRDSSVAIGKDAWATGAESMAIGLGDAASTNPIVSGTNSLGIFMGDQDGMDLTYSSTMGLFGGKMIINPDAPADTDTQADTALEVKGTVKLGRVRFVSASGAAAPVSAASASGASGTVQFNSGGTLAANSSFYWDDGNAALGIGTQVPDDAKIEVAGGTVCVDTNSDGNATSCITSESDIRLKKNVTPINGALDKIGKLRGVEFDWRWDEFNHIRRYQEKPHAIGVIAQEVEKVFPEAMGEDYEGYKTVEYRYLVAPMIEAIKELDAREEERFTTLARENAALKQKVAALEADREAVYAKLDEIDEKVKGLQAHTGYGIDKAGYGMMALIALISALGTFALVSVMNRRRDV